MINTITLPPFKKMCVTIGNLPSSFVESMSYYEALCWMYNYLDKTVIPAINTEGEAITELQTAFTTLKTYVDNYFENLDVQEEINNKLDAMAESGELQEIISEYLNSTAIFAFDNVANLKEATNLINGSYAKTLGYYNINDGGESLYKITDTLDNSAIQETLDNGLYATLIYSDKINIKQLGIQEDVDYTAKFNKVCSIPKIDIIIPSGNFIVKYFTLGNNTNLTGIGKPTLCIDIDNNGGVMSSIGSNVNITNIDFKSLSDSKYGSRIDINGQNNITITDCKFEHFLYTTSIYAMGLLINNSSNVNITNCLFTNNDQDIAFSQGTCNNIYIKNCVFDNMLNFEIETGTISNIYVDECKINTLALFNYNDKAYNIDNTTISNCTIDSISFKGARFKLYNNSILNFSARPWLTQSASVVENINSMYFKEQLNNDPNFNCFSAKTNTGLFNVVRDNWEEQYIPNNITGVKENGIKLISLNNGLTSQIQSIQKTFEVTAMKNYLIRTKMKVRHGESGSFPAGSQLMYLTFYDSNNEQVEDRITVSMEKFETANSETELTEKWIPFQAPEGSSYLRVELFNTRRNVSGKSDTMWHTFKINEISPVKIYDDIEDSKSKLTSTPYSAQISKIRDVRMPGDVIYNTDLATNSLEKWICTSSTSYTPTYKSINLE